jgi:hypothetical protein
VDVLEDVAGAAIGEGDRGGEVLGAEGVEEAQGLLAMRRQFFHQVADAAAAARLHLALVPDIDIVDGLQFGLVRLAEDGAEASVDAQFVGGDVGEDVPVRPAGIRARFVPGLVGDGVDSAEKFAVGDVEVVNGDFDGRQGHG